MPSAFAHAAPALALVPAFAGPDVPKRLWVAGVLCAAAPDPDELVKVLVRVLTRPPEAGVG
jgi:hypothetical protein